MEVVVPAVAGRRIIAKDAVSAVKIDKERINGQAVAIDKRGVAPVLQADPAATGPCADGGITGKVEDVEVAVEIDLAGEVEIDDRPGLEMEDVVDDRTTAAAADDQSIARGAVEGVVLEDEIVRCTGFVGEVL